MIRDLMSSGLLVQGITGRQGRLETQWMLDSGTSVRAGVTPGRGGERVADVPVFDSVAEAVHATGARVSMNYVPASAVVESLYEAVAAGVQVVVVSAENVPTHPLIRVLDHARRAGTRVIGPNSQGVVVPTTGRWGCPGGDDPWDRFAPGDVAVVSRSGGLASELGMFLKSWGRGTSVQLATGGGSVVGTPLVDGLRLAQADPRTAVGVVIGEPAGRAELDVAAAIAAGEISIPVVAFVPGRAAELLPAGLPFGHAPRGGSHGQQETASAKLEALRLAGARAVHSMTEIRDVLERLS